MPDIIKLLPESVANQIAAGEVVQRPASAVKELMENSIDAGATHITLIVKDAGKTLIQVMDDGSGMSETDARMSLERHATSKISKAEDLFTIHTKGFRGEAIASIAAVSQMQLKTKKHDAELGTEIHVAGSKIESQESTSMNAGTSIAVKNLFYNIPARRNFLKSNSVEMRHITDEFLRLALSHTDVTFELFNSDLQVFSLPKSKLSTRIVNIFGKNYQQQLAAIQEVTSDLEVSGYIGKPEFSKKTRGDQYFFVNQRYIKSAYLNHAVARAYQGLIPGDYHPFYVLFIDIDPKKIDINVHPTKTEIKFDDERWVYGIIESAVKKSLGVHNIAPSIDFQSNVNFDLGNPVTTFNSGTKTEGGHYQKKDPSGWEGLYQPLKGEHIGHVESTTEHQEEITFQSRMNTEVPADSLKEDIMDRGTNIIQVLNKYIVAQVKSGMLLIDQQASHERILFEKYLGMISKKSMSSQQFLFPQQIELSPSDFDLIMEMEEQIKSLGFVFSHFGKNTLVVNGIPADAPNGSEKELFEGLIEQFKTNKYELGLDTNENLARSLAKKSCIQSGKKMALDEMNSLIDQLFSCATPEYSPGGKRTMTILNEDHLKSIIG